MNTENTENTEVFGKCRALLAPTARRMVARGAAKRNPGYGPPKTILSRVAAADHLPMKNPAWRGEDFTAEHVESAEFL